MVDLEGIVAARLLGDATLLALICVGPDAEPAVYNDGFVPAEFPYSTKPLIIVGEPQHIGDEDTFDEAIRNEQVTIRFYHKPDGDYLPMKQAAERARTLFKDWGSSVDGGQVINATVSGPSYGPTTDPTLAGRVLRINFLIKET